MFVYVFRRRYTNLTRIISNMDDGIRRFNKLGSTETANGQDDSQSAHM